MVIDGLTVAQERQAIRVAAAMSESFALDFEHFAVIQGDPGSDKLPPTVAYAARLGIYLGNWNEIRGTSRSPVPKDKFVIEVDGEEFDTRRGMTEAVYRTMVAQNPNNYSPDTPLRAIGATGYSFPMTWLTGESASPHWAPVGHVDVGRDGSKEPKRIGLLRGAGHGEARFRPAVVLGVLPEVGS